MTRNPIRRNSILFGDCVEWLRKLDDNIFTAVVTDGPYGLSTHEPEDVRECLRAWISGREFKPKKTGFMGRGWDAWVAGPELWKEVMRVLKPGGHILSFFGTRTYDLGVMAMRLAGAEIRDKIDYFCELQGSLDWVYGSGFPKSRAFFKGDIQPEIEKQLREQGVEGEIEWKDESD